MKYRKLPDTNVQPISEIGFGLWTLTTGWWGHYTDAEAVALLRLARDRGINFFDAADSYSNGRSEALLADAFTGERDQVVIATKVGYDFYSHGENRRGERELPQDFSVDFIREAVEKSLGRLRTDRIDVLQLHNIRFEQVTDDALWSLLENLQSEGKVLSYGIALGPAIGWLQEGVQTIKRRHPHVVQHIYNLFERHPGRSILDAGDVSDRTRHLIRVPHSSGLLEGKYTAETVFPEGDHRRHRPRSWLLDGVKKVEALRLLEWTDRTLGQVALQWLLCEPKIASCLPNIYNEEQLIEFTDAVECPPFTDEERSAIDSLIAINFGVEESSPPKFKGTMDLVS